MPLLIKFPNPLQTVDGLPVSQVYAIINQFEVQRLLRRASFLLGYYVNEVASLPGSGTRQLSVSLPAGFGFSIELSQVGQMGDPTEVLEAYATASLLPLLEEGTTIETVA